ncbi:MAG: adenylate/guanylate cyclase domain-containing protein, partial [Bacteroidota bacterium]
MPKVTYAKINQALSCSETNTSILELSKRNQIPHLSECGGNGQCTTCRIKVIAGSKNISSPSPLEKRLAKVRRWDPSIRLACQCYVKGDVEIQRLLWTSAEVSQLQLELVKKGKAEEKELAILVCDMRNFTNITSKNLAYDMAYLLNRFYTVLGEPILKNDGIIYQYVGDEIVGIFGLSGGTKEQICLNALRAAQGMQYAIEHLNHLEVQHFDTQLKIGIGVNFGTAYVGYLGHPSHQQLAIVGDSINVASRIQSCTKEFKAKILISHSAYFDRNRLDIGAWHKKQLKGIQRPVFLYEFLGFSELDINLELQKSLDLLLQQEEQFAENFYERLFKRAPKIRQLFKGDISAQAAILTHMLVGIVYAMSRPEQMLMGLRKLGKSHIQYGVKPAHYPIVLDVILEVIAECLGHHFTKSTELAWQT